MVRIILLMMIVPMLYISSFPQTQNQTDNFQDITTMDWTTGIDNPNQVSVINTGGIVGSGDRYIRAKSLGGFGAGSNQSAVKSFH